MDEEEEEIEHYINDSKEGVNNISDSKEGFEDRNDSAEQFDVLNDSKNLVVDGSDPKSDPSVDTHTTNGISDIATTDRISERKLYPLFIKPGIQAVETRSIASCGIPSFAVKSISPTRIRNQDIFSPSNSSTARRGSTDHTADKLKSVIGPATRFQGSMDSSDGLMSSHGIVKVTANRVSEAKAYSDYVKNSEFETTKVFEFENNLGTRLNEMTRLDQDISRINPESRINQDSRIIPVNRINSPIQINSPIRPTFNIPLTRPTKIFN